MIDSFDYYKRTEKTKERFSLLINLLKENDITLRTTTMHLVNTIISSPEDVTVRINTRIEIQSAGVKEQFKVR